MKFYETRKLEIRSKVAEMNGPLDVLIGNLKIQDTSKAHANLTFSEMRQLKIL